MTIDDLVLRLDLVVTPDELRSWIAHAMLIWTEQRDPMSLFLIGTAIHRFRGDVTPTFFHDCGIFATADFYHSKAYHILYERAEKGDPSACRWISAYYFAGWSPVEKSEELQLEWLRKAALGGDKMSIAEIAEIDKSKTIIMK